MECQFGPDARCRLFELFVNLDERLNSPESPFIYWKHDVSAFDVPTKLRTFSTQTISVSSFVTTTRSVTDCIVTWVSVPDALV